MSEFIVFQLSQISLLVPAGIMTALYVIIITNWPLRWYQKLFIKNFRNIQWVHDGEIPRLGGMIIYFGFLVYWLLFQNELTMSFIECLLISSLPLIYISIKEDLLHNTRPITRLACMFLSTLLFFLCFDISYPSIEFPIIGEWLANSSLLNLLFFSFCVVVIINGSNLIDGVNGLLPITLLMQCLSLFYITNEMNVNTNMIHLIYLIISIIIFMFFNYPWGKIFLGDTGSYFLGFFVSLLTIIIFSEHPEIPSWHAVLILSYPAFELLFSIIRKSFIGLNPMLPDSGHLHLKLFYVIQNKLINLKISNSLVMPCLVILWGSPFFLLVLIKQSHISIFLALVLFMIIYIGVFFVLPKKNDY